MNYKLKITQLFLAVTCFFTFSSILHAQEWVYVKRAVDGDTLLLRSGERVRLIGIDTPESVHPEKPVQYFSKEASQFTKKLVNHKLVRLEYGDEEYDDYNRILGFIFLKDGTFVNAELIKQGYAFAFRRYKHRYYDDFLKYEKEARQKAIGIWGRFSRGNEKYTVTWVASKRSKIYHHPWCQGGLSIPEKNLRRFHNKKPPKGYRSCRWCIK